MSRMEQTHALIGALGRRGMSISLSDAHEIMSEVGYQNDLADATPNPLERLASAAERIADALEARQTNPDAYEYTTCHAGEINGLRQLGWVVDGVSSMYGDAVMRRPRQQDAPPSDWENERTENYE